MVWKESRGVVRPVIHYLAFYDYHFKDFPSRKMTKKGKIIMKDNTYALECSFRNETVLSYD